MTTPDNLFEDDPGIYLGLLEERDEAVAWAGRLQTTVARLQRVLERLTEWDHFDAAADGEYWRREIRAALEAIT